MGRKRSKDEDERHQPLPRQTTAIQRGPQIRCKDCQGWFLPLLNDAFTPINHNKPDGTPCNY